MSIELVDLWPEELQTDVLSPAIILNFQASKLEERTKGILKAQVTQENSDVDVELHFIIEAPAAGSISSDIFQVMFSPKQCYPCRVYGPEMITMEQLEVFHYQNASTQSELLDKVRKILNSSEVRSILDSFLALSNETSRV